MSDIDWNEAPEGATHHVSGCEPNWYKQMSDGSFKYWDDDKTWQGSGCTDNLESFHSNCTITPRPTAPKPCTRDEALQFLVERLDTWPTDIADAPLCPGWGWVFNGNHPEFEELNPSCPELQYFIGIDSWDVARPAFQQFVSVEDAQPATDMVNHPPHYQSDTGVECIDAIRAALGAKGFQAYCIGNTMKYLWREKSDKAEDLRKAAWYLNRAIEEAK